MAQQTIGLGASPNDGTGDPLRTAFTKANDNFTELYSSVSGFAPLSSPPLTGSVTVDGSITSGDDIATNLNTITINGGHVTDGGNDYGLTIRSFEPGLSLVDRSAGAGSVLFTGNGAGVLDIWHDPAGNDGTIGHTANANTVRSASFSKSIQRLYVDNVEVMRLDSGGLKINGTYVPLSVPTVSDAVYGAGWNGNTDAPTKNAVYDKIETIGAPEGTAVKSTGETGGSKFLREDGDGTCSWQAIPGGGDALTASPLSQFAATTSAQLAGVISDETGSGALVFGTSPVLVTPSLGTPSVLNLTNATALPQSGILNSTSYAIGLGTIDLGHASDTTISRVAAGRIAVEGAELAKLASPTFTGTPAAPTAAAGTSTTQVATTAFVGAALTLVSVNAQTGTTYTLVIGDAGKKITMNNGSANVLTVPANATVAFAVGTILNVTQIGAGATSITGATGVTINGVSAGSAAIAARWTSATLTKTATDTWLMEGNHAVVA